MTSNPENNRTSTPSLSMTDPSSKSQRLARAVADVVRSGLIILFWIVVAVAGLSGAFVVLKIVLFLLRLANRALGL